MLIGEVAKKYGVSVDTLRYYEKIHLLIPRRNRKGRFYTERELVKLEQILLMKKLLFSLEEIKGILEIDELIDRGIEKGEVLTNEVDKMEYEIKRKYSEILQKEQQLSYIKKHLEELLQKIKEYKGEG